MRDARFVENILQSLMAGVLIGAIYGLMCSIGPTRMGKALRAAADNPAAAA